MLIQHLLFWTFVSSSVFKFVEEFDQYNKVTILLFVIHFDYFNYLSMLYYRNFQPKVDSF